MVLEAVDRDELLEELHRLREELERPPTWNDVKEHGEYAATTYTAKFGTMEDAREAAGFDDAEVETWDCLAHDLRRRVRESSDALIDVDDVDTEEFPLYRVGGRDD